jgi:GT2 family glycosyltransferase
MTVTVIIPVLNNWRLTRDCLVSLAAHTPAHEPDVRVIVADNGSTDETPTACPALGRELFGERFAPLRFETNRNFGPACNAAAALAESDLLLFLNNDTLPAPGWLPPLIQELAAGAHLAGVGPLLLYPDESVQHLGIAFWPGGGGVAHLYRNLPGGHALAGRTREFQALTAAALLVRRTDFLAVGGFDEGYVNGFEDVDLGLKLTAGGRRMRCVPQSRITHLESRTPRRKEHDAANSSRLAARWDMRRYGDLPELAAADGYRLRVLPDLELTLDVTPEREREMLARLGPRFDPGRCFALLDEEPFWMGGWTLLGDFLERAGSLELAYQVLIRHFGLSLGLAPEDYARQARLLRAMGQDASKADEHLRRQRAMMAQAPARLQTITDNLRASGKAGHVALIPLFEQAVSVVRIDSGKDSRI